MSETDPTSQPARKEENWERSMLEKIALDLLKEHRRSRRWGIFFKLFFAVYLVALFFAFQAQSVKPITGKHTALIDIDGVIGANADVSADSILSGLEAAFDHKDAVGVILRVNSPGGSPVQAGLINDEITRLRKKHPKVKVYTVIEDMCASGCYYIAAASDKIFADKASIVGSIGVLMDGFGFVGAMKKLGIERRLMTSGEHKGMLDPFSPLKSDEKEHAQKMLDEIHQQFISVVKAGRGDRLSKDPGLFSGLFWTGEEAVGLGLVDGLASTETVARDVIGAEDIVDYTPHEDLFERFADRFGMAFARAMGIETLRQSFTLR
jgi:protease-4